MVCHIAVEMWWQGVTPAFPRVASGYRAMPRCARRGIRTPMSFRTLHPECSAYPSFARQALVVGRIRTGDLRGPPAALPLSYHYDDLTRRAVLVQGGLPVLLFSGQDSRRQVLLTDPGDRRRFDGNPIRVPLRMLTNLERMTGIEPATCTLARCRATNCATSTLETHAFRRGAPSLAQHGAAVERPLHGRRGAGTDGSAFRSRSGWSPTTVEPPSGVEPEASFLPRTRSATELWRHHPKVGRAPSRIRTGDPLLTRQPLWPD